MLRIALIVSINRITVNASIRRYIVLEYEGIIQKRKNKEGIYDNNRGTLFFINRSSKDEEVDFAILLKNDKMIFLVIKLITITTKVIEAVIIKAANPLETRALSPLEVKKLTISL